MDFASKLYRVMEHPVGIKVLGALAPCRNLIAGAGLCVARAKKLPYLKQTMEAVDRVLLGRPEKERESIVRDSYKAGIEQFFYFARLATPGGARAEYERGRMTTLMGWEHLESALGTGRGIVIVSCHLGRFYDIFFALGRRIRGRRITVLRGYRSGWRSAILQNAGTLTGNEFADLEVTTPASAISCVRALKAGHLVVTMLDYCYPGTHTTTSKFLGLNVRVPSGIGHLAGRTGSLIVPVVTYRAREGRIIKVLGQIEPAMGSTDKEDGDAAIRHALAGLENEILAHPGQWLHWPVVLETVAS